jgi:hypothetical protein
MLFGMEAGKDSKNLSVERTIEVAKFIVENAYALGKLKTDELLTQEELEKMITTVEIALGLEESKLN